MAKYICILLLSLITICACNKQDLCLQYASNTATIIFKTYTDSLQVKDTSLPAPTFIYNGFYTQYNATNRANIFLNQNTNYTSVALLPDSALTEDFDSIRFYYKPTLHFISKECGYNFNYTIDSVSSTNNFIKSIKLLNNSVTSKTNVLNVQVIY